MPARKRKISPQKDVAEFERVTRTTRSTKVSKNIVTKNKQDKKPSIQKKAASKSVYSPVTKVSSSTRNKRPSRVAIKEVLDKKIAPPTKKNSQSKVEKKSSSNNNKTDGSDQANEVIEEIVGARRKRKNNNDEMCVQNKVTRSRSCRAKIDVQPAPAPEQNSDASQKKSNKGIKAPEQSTISRNRKVNASRTKKVQSKDEEVVIKKSKTTESLPKKMEKRKENPLKKKTEAVSTKNALTSEAILNLLSDSEEEPSVSKKEKSTMSPKKSKPKEKSRWSFFKSGGQESGNTSQLETSKNTSQVPIWKRMEQLTKVDEFTGGDVYDPHAYISDLEPNDKKKKPRKRKKDTRAIIVFGNKNARQAVKEAHNLKTPTVTKKNVGKIGGGTISGGLAMPAAGHVSSDVSCGAHNYFDSFQGSVATHPSIQIEEVEPVHVEPESQPEVIPPQQIIQLAVKTGCNSSIAPTTPVIPKNFSKRLKLQKENVSTPKLVENTKKAETTKEMIKNAFGFDSEDDEDDMSCSDSILSPVKKLPGGNSFFDASKHFDSRMSVASFRDYEPVKSSLWRFEVEQVSKPRADLLRQVQAMEKQKVEQGLAKLKNKKFSKSSRTSPCKLPPPITIPDTATSSLANINEPSSNLNGFIHISANDKKVEHDVELNLVDNEDTAMADTESVMNVENESQYQADQPSQSIRTSPRKTLSVKNAYDVLKSAQTTETQRPDKLKKLTKKMTKKTGLNDSSLLEDPVLNKINKNGQLRKKVVKKKVSTAATDHKIEESEGVSVADKENSKQSRKMEANQTLPVKTYSMNIGKRKDINKTVSYDQSSTLYKKPTKKDKKVQTWANLQTSHFSEIDDFDISFI